MDPSLTVDGMLDDLAVGKTRFVRHAASRIGHLGRDFQSIDANRRPARWRPAAEPSGSVLVLGGKNGKAAASFKLVLFSGLVVNPVGVVDTATPTE
jgi:hypothetical protein